MIGQTISHYKILEKLGEGGMGEVYLAEDTKLERKVALKFLPMEFTKNKEANERFEREAKAAATLNHPNIVTIYEINQHEDQTYIAMEYVEGETLKDRIASGPLPLAEVIDYTTQICEGLHKAHEAGIVHRDIKPQNILIDKDGRVKILDFGLAKLRVGANGYSPSITKIGTTMGTIHYMSPEQSMGKEVDHRTDIWSIGVILYEMLTGQLPFKGEYEQAIIYSIINEKPDAFSNIITDIPQELEDLVNQMLEKNPDKRHQNVSEIKLTLKDIFNKFKSQNKEQKMTEITSTNKKKKFLLAGVSAFIIITLIFIYIIFLSKPAPLESKSIAVLPFKNMSEDKQNEYFCDGITEDIITQLSKITDLKVTSRTSVFYFKNKEKKIKDIANELGVTTILEGSVRQTKGKVRITAQLINARTDGHLWAETYDREMKDIFDIQSDVASQIAKTLKVKLLTATSKRIYQKPTENIEAYKLYLRGRFHWNRRTPQDLEKAIAYFEKAVEMDPEYALGYAGLAMTYQVIGDLQIQERKVVYPKAEVYCLKALKLDNNLAEAHAALGGIKNYWTWDFPGAEQALKKSISLNPNYATAHQWLAEHYFIRGKFKLAHKELDLAEELDPFSFITKVVRANIYLSEKKYPESIKLANRVLLTNPNIELTNLILINAYLGEKSYEKVLELASHTNIYQLSEFMKFEILISQGKINQARKFFQELKATLLEVASIYPGILAIIYAELGDMDEAIKWYQKAIKQRDIFILGRYGLGLCETLLNDPRVQKMLKDIGLEE
jgi:serine/threonine protein kinase/Tfp pilus assembly protein PilF